MESGEDAYQILGVSREATELEIKKAYRKLALQHHPDKQQTTEEKQQATAIFAKISNAYEILSDPQKRQEYDMDAENDYQEQYFHNNGPNGFFRNHHRHHPFQFHDPFEVFNAVFREEFARHNAAVRGAGFNDAFFTAPFFSSSSMMRGSLFDVDPFFGGMGSRRGDPFFGNGGFGGADPFALMQQSMMSIMPPRGGGNNTNGTTSSFVQTVSSVSNGNNRGSSSVSTSTTTRIVNGRRQTVKETVIQKPDGSIERKVETDDGDMGMLDQDRAAAAPPPPPRRKLLGGRQRSQNKQSTDGQRQLEGRERQQDKAPERKKQKKRGNERN